MTSKYARDDLLCDCTKFYNSKTRKGKYVDLCGLCAEIVEGECKRAIWAIDQYGHNNYTVLHKECFKKSLSTEIPKSEANNKEEQKLYKQTIKELKKLEKLK